MSMLFGKNGGRENERLPLLLNDRQTAELLGISTRTLWTLKERGAIPHVPVGSKVKYDPEDIKDFIRQNKRRGDESMAGDK